MIRRFLTWLFGTAPDPEFELRCELDRIHDAYPSIRWVLKRDEFGLLVSGSSSSLTLLDSVSRLCLWMDSTGCWSACHCRFPHHGQWPTLTEACASVHDAHVRIIQAETGEHPVLRGDL